MGARCPHLIETVTALAKRGVGFRSLTEAIDTTTPGGRLVFPANGFGFAWLCVLGPDLEDFEHVRTAVQAGHMKPQHMVLVMNEGAIRQGQNPAGVFDPVTTNADF